MRNKKWTREELILAFNLYCKIPFTKINYRYVPIIELSKILNRTPDAVAYKLANYARLDPSLKQRNISGLTHGSKGEVVIWQEFHDDWESLSFESEKLLAIYKNETIESLANIDIYDLPMDGQERNAIIKVRVNQNFFRSVVLSSYRTKCCITGLSIKALLVGSHIIPWSKDPDNRMNPENGICLNVLHDKAFDRGLFTISEDHEVRLSNILLDAKNDNIVKDFFLPYHGKEISKPDRFLPNEHFLDYHRSKIFIS